MKDAPLRHRLEYFAYLPIRTALTSMPVAVAQRFGAVLGDLVFRLDRRRRRLAYDNLTRAFPEKSAAERGRIARASYRHLGASLFNTFAGLRLSREELCERIEIDGFEHLLDAEAAGRGVILLSAHLGAWEVAAWALAFSGRPVHVIGRPADNPHLDREMRRIRERWGNRMITKRGAARSSVRVLHQGGYLALLVDQHAGTKSALRLPFFGRPAWTSTLPARISVRTGAPVVPGYGCLEPRGRYRMIIREPIVPPSEPDEHTIAELTQRYVEAGEAEIRRRPDEWMWMHRRWRDE
jgi:KDO2-lipid IV(A) lauroyltransferase